MPPAVSGYPSQRRNQSITTASSWLGPLALNQVAALMLKPLARKSASTPGHVGADGTKPNARGWSWRRATDRMSRTARSII